MPANVVHQEHEQYGADRKRVESIAERVNVWLEAERRDHQSFQLIGNAPDPKLHSRVRSIATT